MTMKLGFVTFSTPGHVNPSCTLAASLRDRGHEVVFFSLADGAAAIAGRGFEVSVYGQDLLSLEKLEASYRRLGELSGWAAMRFTLAGMQQRTIAGLRDLPALFRASHLDGLVIDQLAPDASAVARWAGLPFVNICNALPANPSPDVPPIFSHGIPPGQHFPSQTFAKLRTAVLNQIGTWLIRPIEKLVNDFQDSHHLPRYRGQAVSSDLAELTQIPRCFDFPGRTTADNFYYTGPWHSRSDRPPTQFPWHRLDPDRDLVYVSMGTLQNRIESIFQIIASACRELPVQLVVSVGGRGDAARLNDLPGNPIVVRYAPQIELLQQASLCITHAGLNTTLECLAAGVPMVAIPVTNDQPGVAARIQFHRLGGRILFRGVSVDSIRAAVQSTLHDSRIRASTEQMKRKIAEENGLEKATDLIQRAITGRL